MTAHPVRRYRALLPILLVGSALLLAGCGAREPTLQFRHHFVASTFEGGSPRGFATPALADFDKDGDLDFAVGVRGDALYWYENAGDGRWPRHPLGPMPVATLGAIALDVDRDGWTDVLTGGVWYRNPQTPRVAPFAMFRYDASIDTEIHDLIAADVDRDGRDDVVALGDKEGLFWYAIPDSPAVDRDWLRTTVAAYVVDEELDIHGGVAPGGAGDLDGDGDPDLVLPDRWLENREGGAVWEVHRLPFGGEGPWGLSARSWIVDLDEDGDRDIVLVDSDRQESEAVWLENVGGQPPSFTRHELPTPAPGARGSFHSLAVGDFDLDTDADIFAAEQEDPDILPYGAGPRAYVWENLGGSPPVFAERVVFAGTLGFHDATAGDLDRDGDLDVVFKVWDRWELNANGGRAHVGWLENLRIP